MAGWEARSGGLEEDHAVISRLKSRQQRTFLCPCHQPADCAVQPRSASRFRT